MQVADIDGNGRSVLQAVGVFWATVFSTAAFVIPRLLQVHRDQRAGRGRNTIVVSGISGVSGVSLHPTSTIDRNSIIFDNSDIHGQSTALDNDKVDESPYDEVEERPPSTTVGENEDKHESYTEQDSSSDKPENSGNARIVDWTGELHDAKAYLQNHEYEGKVLTTVAENPGECLKSEESKVGAVAVQGLSGVDSYGGK
jgi:hypothetical protein